METRLYEHENGLNPNAYTCKRRPLKLVFCERFNDINQAIAFEKQVKGWRRAKKEALINGHWHLLPELSKTAKIIIRARMAFAHVLRQAQHDNTL